jgi:triphosphoribosyl-dephospho-CoA synthase
MTTLSASQVSDCYRQACALDVQAFKPGNVSMQSSGHGMEAVQFLSSAASSAPKMACREISLGQRILSSIQATHAQVGCNTNLGIVLLCAPLVQAHYRYPGIPFTAAVKRVLAQATLADTEAVYQAIRLASPGGLGRVAHHDVTLEVRQSLVEVMRYASDRDLIARQYANGFAELLGDAQAYLQRALQHHAEPETALTDLFLYLLVQYPDTHIMRKHDEQTALRVAVMAADVHRDFRNADSPQQTIDSLGEFDEQLKRRSINPGTTADFCVAAYFLNRLMQAKSTTGTVPGNPRFLQSQQAAAPQF